MTKRSILVAVAFAMLVTGVSNSSSFARNAAAGPGAAGPGAAGPGAAGPGSSSSGSGGGGGGGAHVFLDAAIVGVFPPRVRKPVTYHPPVAVQVMRDARCALGPTELGYFGPERVMLTQICANQL